ncbi:retrovirus-related pol polyprotein from transposon TNT 1-94 [Tanacetum coccineum]
MKGNNLNLQLKYQHLQESFDNKKSQASQEAPDFNSFFKIKNLEHQILEKDNVIRHLKDLVANVNDRSREPYNAIDVTALIEQNECAIESGNQKANCLLTVCTRPSGFGKLRENYLQILVTNGDPQERNSPLGKTDVDPNKNWGTENSNSPNLDCFQDAGPRQSDSENDHLGGNQIGLWRLMLWGTIVISEYTAELEGLGHNLFSVGQFCDSDLEVAFRKHTCFVRDINGTDILKGSRSTNLYTISMDEMMKSSPICLLSKASKGLPRLKFEKDHLCSACQLGKSKKFSHRPKSENTNMEVLHTLHMDLCGPMRVQSIKGKKYILVIVDDYSRFTWVKFLRSKDETPEFVTNFLKQIQSVPRTPQQNDVVERRNRTLVEAARTMMIFSKAPMFLWAEAVATACYTQNRSLIHTRHNKTPVELVMIRRPDLYILPSIRALCYPYNERRKLGKISKPKPDMILVGISLAGRAIESTTKRTRRLMETSSLHIRMRCTVNGSLTLSLSTAWRESHASHYDRVVLKRKYLRFLRRVEAEMVSPEVESEKWRRPLLHWMYDALNVSTDGREEDFFPRNGV